MVLILIVVQMIIVAYQLSQMIPFLRSTHLMSLLIWSLGRFHLTSSLLIPILLSFSLTQPHPSHFTPFFSLPLFLPSLDPPKSSIAEFETFVLDSPYLDQILDDSNLDRLEDHLEVKDMTLGLPMSFYCHISFDWLCSTPRPSPFRDVGLHFHHSDHSWWSLHSYINIFVRLLTCVSDFTYTHNSSVWASKEP